MEVAPMSILRISLFGGFEIAQDSRQSELKVTRTIQALLAYLLLQRHRNHPREKLAALFWGDYSQSRAHNCLNTALWRARQLVEPEGVDRGTYLICTTQGEIGFNSKSEYWLDVAVFEEGVRQALAHPCEMMGAACAEKLEMAMGLYSGELLEGFYYDWALAERERLRDLYVKGLARLMRYYERQGIYDTSVMYAQKILYLDPLREEIHRDLIRLFLKTGQRVQAMQQYETCRSTLAAELNVEPMEETRMLLTQMIEPTANSRMHSVIIDQHSDLYQVVQQLQLVLQSLDATRQQLQRVIECFSRSGGSNGMK
jgi:DNA-binding SARP family transcriptional activator